MVFNAISSNARPIFDFCRTASNIVKGGLDFVDYYFYGNEKNIVVQTKQIAQGDTTNDDITKYVLKKFEKTVNNLAKCTIYTLNTISCIAILNYASYYLVQECKNPIITCHLANGELLIFQFIAICGLSYNLFKISTFFNKNNRNIAQDNSSNFPNQIQNVFNSFITSPSVNYIAGTLSLMAGIKMIIDTQSLIPSLLGLPAGFFFDRHQKFSYSNEKIQETKEIAEIKLEETKKIETKLPTKPFIYESLNYAVSAHDYFSKNDYENGMVQLYRLHTTNRSVADKLYRKTWKEFGRPKKPAFFGENTLLDKEGLSSNCAKKADIIYKFFLKIGLDLHKE